MIAVSPAVRDEDVVFLGHCAAKIRSFILSKYRINEERVKQIVRRFLSWTAFDYFLVASTKEGLCSSIIDGFASETPVIATRAGGIPDLVRSGETGYLAESKDPTSIANCILSAIQNDNTEIVSNAARFAKEELNSTSMYRSYMELYRKILSGTPKDHSECDQIETKVA